MNIKMLRYCRISVKQDGVITPKGLKLIDERAAYLKIKDRDFDICFCTPYTSSIQTVAGVLGALRQEQTRLSQTSSLVHTDIYKLIADSNFRRSKDSESGLQGLYDFFPRKTMTGMKQNCADVIKEIFQAMKPNEVGLAIGNNPFIKLAQNFFSIIDSHEDLAPLGYVDFLQIENSENTIIAIPEKSSRTVLKNVFRTKTEIEAKFEPVEFNAGSKL